MIIKKIILNNIRSYANEEIIFPEGATLLSGDIGSGKTSVLLGIEFALFGLQPGQKGSSLLRNDVKEGGVLLEFEVNNKKIIIERNLKRGKSISQEYCAITIDGNKREMAVTELKNLVLEILNYPKDFAKKQNILYRFTVYTPQESMKEIILQDSETRINTLRHIFGIDKYKRILENTSILTSKLREEKREKEGMIFNIENDKLNLLEKEQNLEIKHYNLSSMEKELFLRVESRKKIQEEQEELDKKIEEKKNFEKEIEKTQIMILNKKEHITHNKKNLSDLVSQIEELKKLSFDDSKIQILESEINYLKKQKEKINEDNIKVTSLISSLNLKNSDNEKIKEKIVHIEVCPTCLQDVNETYKQNVVNKLDYNSSSNKSKLEELNLEKLKIYEKIQDLTIEISKKEKDLNDFKILKIKLQNIEEKQKRVEEIEKNILLFEKDIEILEKHLGILKKSVFDFKKYESLYEESQKNLDKAFKDERQAEIKVAELKKEIDFFSKQIQEIKEKIKKTEEIKKQLNYLIELENWLSENFSQLISVIERNVMSRLKSDFSELFSKWFSMLVSDSFNVKIDDEFTPVIEQQDYEINYEYLSGGERTAIALAYRLALNQIINSLLSKINTKDIVILDEPTDGFSEQQLDKMRDVLLQLNVKQLLLVSHEQKIEGFVENILRFKKENGTTKLVNYQSEKFIKP